MKNLINIHLPIPPTCQVPKTWQVHQGSEYDKGYNQSVTHPYKACCQENI